MRNPCRDVHLTCGDDIHYHLVMRNRNNRRIGFWVGLAIFAVLSYPLSFFPACWLCTWLDGWRLQPRAARCVSHFYAPLVIAFSESPEGVQKFVAYLMEVGAAKDTEAWFIQDPDVRGLGWDRPGCSWTVLSYRTDSAP